MLGGAGVLSIIGVWLPSDKIELSDAGTVLLNLGTGSMMGCIPLFIASGRNKRKAMKVSGQLQFQKSPFIM